MVKIGIIGGSGLEDPNLIEISSERWIKTPYGAPSSEIREGKIKGTNVVILSRHGFKHNISPSNINFRANIWCLKKLGCTHVLASTAVGSLRNQIEPGDIVFPNQFIDFTKRRDSTFFDGDELVHTAMSDPFCAETIKKLIKVAKDLNISHHTNKTILTIEGPRFSTKSESHMFRSWGADIINMSSCPEITLCREKKMHYASIAMSTDYDCWKEDEEPVSWELVQKTMKKNAENVVQILLETIPKLKSQKDICIF